MQITFIHPVDDIFSPEKPLRSHEQIQFGISYISSLLKKHSHQTKLLILSRMLGKKNKVLIDKHIRNFSPRLICFTAVSTEYHFITNLAQYIKKSYPNIFLLIGGPHVSLNPGEAVSDNFDALCIGEGEYPTLELVSQLEKNIQPSNIPNLWIKNGVTIEKKPPRPFLQDLDNLPFPDREMWQEWIDEEPDAGHSLLLGRGCPFQCTYCCNHALRNLANGLYVRFRSPDNIVKELKEISVQYPNKDNIYLEVETIAANKDWVMALCSGLQCLNTALNTPFSYTANLRITPHLDVATLFAAFKKANFSTINIGVESGCERVRREILKRHYSNQDIINAVKLARRYDLKVCFYNLIGIPGETYKDFKATIQINRICQPDKTFNHIFFPYPGTKLYSICKEQGLLPKVIDTDLERCKAILDLPRFTKKQIHKAFVWFDYNVFKGHKPLFKILPKVLISCLMSNSFLHYFYRKLSCSKSFKKLRKSFFK